jgi:enamine deaminase RidA (YjgF/YER057c/UK114 family)
MRRTRYSSNTPWEPIVGYSRAIRVGSMVYTSGTTATDTEGKLIGVDDPYTQTIQTIKNIEKALTALGAGLQDVVRTRIYVLDIEAHWQEVGRAHGEFFRDIRPVTSMIEIKRLIDARMLVEIEAEAILIAPSL